MLQSRFKRDNFNVIPYYKAKNTEVNEVFLSQYEKEQKIDLIKNLYSLAKEIDKEVDNIEIYSTDTLDDCVLLLSDFIVTKDPKFEIIIEGCFVFGLIADVKWDSGSIPIKAFIDQRKNKEFHKFLLELLANFKWHGHSVFDNYLHEISMEMGSESYYEVIDPESDRTFDDYQGDYFSYKIWKKIIEPYISLIPEGYYSWDKKYLNKITKKHPKWKKFIYDSIETFEMGAKFHDMAPCNVSEADREESVLQLQDLFHFRYEYDPGLYGSPYDENILHIMNDIGQSMITESPYAVSIYRPGDHITLLKLYERQKRILKFTNLYFEEYECFKN